MVNNKHLNYVFFALADTTRREILSRLSNTGESPVNSLAKPFRMSPPAISRHLRVLEKACLRRRQGRLHLIQPRHAGLQEAQAWMNQCAAAWDFSFDALDSLLKKRKGKIAMNSEVTINGDSLQITRIFEAPRAEVFEWWSQAEKLQQWSGCKECVGCEVTMDFRVGGSFTQKMRIAVKGGVCDFSFVGIYEEIVVPEKIRYRADLGQGVTRVQVEFFAMGERTRIVVTQDGFLDPNVCKIVSQGTLESFAKLDLILAGEAAVRPA